MKRGEKSRGEEEKEEGEERGKEGLKINIHF